MRIQGLSDAASRFTAVLAPLIRLRSRVGVLLGSMPLRVLLCCCDVFIIHILIFASIGK